MNKEGLKNFILVGLVLLSFGLTTQLWLNIPIERKISGDQAFSGQDSIKDYNLSSFVLPKHIVVNFGGQSHTKLINDSAGSGFFTDIYSEILHILEYLLADEGDVDIMHVSKDEWIGARTGKSIEINYRWAVDISVFESILNIKRINENMPVAGIKGVVLSLGRPWEVLIDDGTWDIIYKAELTDVTSVLDELVDQLEEQDPVKYWTLGEIGYSDDQNFYVPLDMSSFNLPVGVAIGELDTDREDVLDAQASEFFKDMSLVRKIAEMNGSFIYTDSQNALLRIDRLGYLEYMVYSHAEGDKGKGDIKSAIDVALEFINAHGGIPEQLYIEDIQGISDKDYKGYLLRFNYAYNGLPFFRRGNLGASAIEIMVTEGKVVKYTRNVHRITKAKIIQKPVLYPVEAADVVAEAISGFGSTKKLPAISDMYLGYCIDLEDAKDYRACPVWYIETEEGTFIVDAYEGVLLK